jgi:hypothetical protein
MCPLFQGKVSCKSIIFLSSRSSTLVGESHNRYNTLNLRTPKQKLEYIGKDKLLRRIVQGMGKELFSED